MTVDGARRSAARMVRLQMNTSVFFMCANSVRCASASAPYADGPIDMRVGINIGCRFMGDPRAGSAWFLVDVCRCLLPDRLSTPIGHDEFLLSVAAGSSEELLVGVIAAACPYDVVGG